MRRPPKPTAFAHFLSEGGVYIHVDARRLGVLLPTNLLSNGHVILEYGLNMAIPIPDLRFDEHGVRATLSFWRTPHETYVPWSAVYAIGGPNGLGVQYDEDMPKDLVPVAKPAPKKPKLRLVPEDDSEGDQEPTERKRPSLRLVN